MLKTAFLFLVTLSIAVAGGAGSAWCALQLQEGVGAVQVGNWTTMPEYGTVDADPYSQARFAREGALALGQSEGIVFFTEFDAAGARLRRDCAYRVEGAVPPARFWTLYVAGGDRQVLPPIGRRTPAIHSQRLLRNTDGSFAIAVGPHAMPGNWLPVAGQGPVFLVMTLYDTAVASNADIARMELPQVLRTDCDA